MYRNTYIEINLDNLKNNVINIISSYKYKYYIGVVKGNAYGHGYGIIDALIKSGVNFLATSSLEESLMVRDYNKDIPIICLQPINKDYLEICAKRNISICIDDLEYYKSIKNLKYKLNVHLKIDSGMNRLGFDNKEMVKEVYDEIGTSKYLTLEGLFTHFATFGISDKSYDNQVISFQEITSLIDLSKIPVVHIDRSGTMILHNKLPFCNGVRLGIVMYGYDIFSNKNKDIKSYLRSLKLSYIQKKDNISKVNNYPDLNLKPAFKLISEVIETKMVKKGEYVGYGTLYKASEDINIAILDIGYNDGISKRRTGSMVLINNNKYQIIGSICMGMTIVKVDANVKKHDKAIIIGDDVSAKYVANYLNTSIYETLLMLDSSIPRIYK